MSAAKKIKLDRQGPLTGPEAAESDDEIDIVAAIGAELGIAGVSPAMDALDAVGTSSSPSENTASAGATIQSLSVDTIASIFGYLTWKEILPARVCRTFREAASGTLVPFVPEYPHEFCVDSLRRYDALAGMARALPNLQQICFGGDRLMSELEFEHGEERVPTFLGPEDRGQSLQFFDSSDPDAAVVPTREIDIVSNFPKLRSLVICGVRLNGRYPCLFGFPHLQRLHIYRVKTLKFDLEMLSALPALKDLNFGRMPLLQGSMKNLRVLKDTLRSISIEYCPAVCGDLMELADFPRLEKLHLKKTPLISGDVRQVECTDFPMLQQIHLPHSVYGCSNRPLERISDAPEVMNAICRLKRRMVIRNDKNVWSLASDSPDRYPPVLMLDRSKLEPPFWIEIVEAGSCIGWRWTARSDIGACKTNWLDDEPDRESLDGKVFYLREQLEVSTYKDFVNPPSEAEYKQLSSRVEKAV